MSQSRMDDLIDRLLSRKLALCVLMIALALIGFWSGNLTFPQLMTAAITAAGVYSATNAVETIVTRPTAPAPVVSPIMTPAQLGDLVDRLHPVVVAGVVEQMRATPAPPPDSVLIHSGPATRTWVDGVPRGTMDATATAVGPTAWPPADQSNERSS